MSEQLTRYQRSIARRTQQAESFRDHASKPTTGKITSLLLRLEAWRIEPHEGAVALADELAAKREVSRERISKHLAEHREKLREAMSDDFTMASPSLPVTHAPAQPTIEQPIHETE